MRFSTFFISLVSAMFLFTGCSDNSPEESQKYNVTSIPLVVVEKDGVVVERFQGLTSKMAYVNAINEAIG